MTGQRLTASQQTVHTTIHGAASMNQQTAEATEIVGEVEGEIAMPAKILINMIVHFELSQLHLHIQQGSDGNGGERHC